MNDRPPKWNPPPVLQCRASDNSEPASLPPCTNDYTVKLVVRLEPEALKQLKEMAGGSNKRPTVFARDILYRFMVYKPGKREKVFAPSQDAKPGKAPAPNGMPKAHTASDVERLFECGNSISAIAAITKFPYKTISQILGAYADRLAQNGDDQ